MNTKLMIFSLLLQALNAFNVEVHDRNRKCPSGYDYYGEVDLSDLAARDYWLQGDRTQIYSCYSLHQGPADWLMATQKCSETDGELLSVNSPGEQSVLVQSKLANTGGSIITSGISLSEDTWTWFGAGENISEPDILDMLENSSTNSSNTQCVWLDWEQTEDGNVTLSYSSKDCVAPSTNYICEVRVYTQTWYYWATANWLQILFCLSLVLLIISTCVTVSMYSSGPRSRRSRANNGELSSSPPPYTAQDTNTKSSNKYAEKGKELLAKIVFYRQAEDKQKLTPDA